MSFWAIRPGEQGQGLTIRWKNGDNYQTLAIPGDYQVEEKSPYNPTWQAQHRLVLRTPRTTFTIQSQEEPSVHYQILQSPPIPHGSNEA